MTNKRVHLVGFAASLLLVAGLAHARESLTRSDVAVEPKDGGSYLTEPKDGGSYLTEPKDGGSYLTEPKDGGSLRADPKDGG